MDPTQTCENPAWRAAVRAPVMHVRAAREMTGRDGVACAAATKSFAPCLLALLLLPPLLLFLE